MVDSPTLRKLSLDPEKLEVRRFAAMADAPNTLRGYQSDWKDFLKWCKKRNHLSLPASPDDVALYARHCAVSLKLKFQLYSDEWLQFQKRINGPAIHLQPMNG